MNDIRQRLESDLNRTRARLRLQGGAGAADELRGSPGANVTLGDDMDVVRVDEEREMSLVTRSLLMQRMNRLAMALERLDAGDYGVCEQCDEPIAPARLRAMPEVATCVTCQNKMERARQFEPVGVGFSRSGLDED